MNLLKKVSLMLLVGFISIYIGLSLFKGTSALSDVPANSSFDDINFYKCVIDAYNSGNKTKLDYKYSINDDELKTITSLTCESKNVVSAKGLEKIVNLTYLNLRENKLTSLNVSNNTKLTYLSVSNNNLISFQIKSLVNLNNIQKIAVEVVNKLK